MQPEIHHQQLHLRPFRYSWYVWRSFLTQLRSMFRLGLVPTLHRSAAGHRQSSARRVSSSETKGTHLHLHRLTCLKSPSSPAKYLPPVVQPLLTSTCGPRPLRTCVFRRVWHVCSLRAQKFASMPNSSRSSSSVGSTSSVMAICLGICTKSTPRNSVGLCFSLTSYSKPQIVHLSFFCRVCRCLANLRFAAKHTTPFNIVNSTSSPSESKIVAFDGDIRFRLGVEEFCLRCLASPESISARLMVFNSTSIRKKRRSSQGTTTPSASAKHRWAALPHLNSSKFNLHAHVSSHPDAILEPNSHLFSWASFPRRLMSGKHPLFLVTVDEFSFAQLPTLALLSRRHCGKKSPRGQSYRVLASTSHESASHKSSTVVVSLHTVGVLPLFVTGLCEMPTSNIFNASTM